MTVVDMVVVGLVVAAVASRFFVYKLPKDTRPKKVRRTDFSTMFQRHIPADPKTDGTKVGKVSARVPRIAGGKPKEKAVPTVKKVSAKELAAMSGLEKIKALDPAFTEKTFLEGAKTAFGYFYQCRNAKDEQGLANLCAPRLVDRVVGEWEQKSFQQVNVDSISSVKLGEARVSGRTAIVEALIEATLKTGSTRKKVVSTWVLARAMGSDEPNWELQDMREARA